MEGFGIAQPPFCTAEVNWIRFASNGSTAEVARTARSTAMVEKNPRLASAICKPGPTPILANWASFGSSMAGAGFATIALLMVLRISTPFRDAGTKNGGSFG